MNIGKPNICPISWMCKNQTSVSHSSTESEIVSLDAGLRIDGLLALDLWDMVFDVLRQTNSTARHGKLAHGDLCGDSTPFHQRKHNQNINWNEKARGWAMVKRGLRTHQHTFFSRRVSVVHLWRQRSCHQDDYQGQKVQQWDTCPEPTELRLTGCSTESTWNQRSKSNMFLTKASFSPDDWNHLLRLFKKKRVSRCSLAANSAIFFLIRSESRAPCQREVKKRLPVKVHRWRSQNQWFQRRWDHSTWFYAARRARGKIIRGIWGYRSIRWTSMKDKVIILVQGDFYGQRLQQQSFKTWSTRTISTWLRSPFLLQKKIGIAAVYSFTMETFKTNVLIWRMFMLSSMKADRIICRTWRSRGRRTSRKFRAYSISLRNWYWSIMMKFWISIRLTVHLPHGRDQYCLTIKWSSGQKQKYVSTQIPFSAWVRWMKAKMRFLNSKVKWMNSKCPFLTRIAGNRLRCNWIRVENCSRYFSSLQILQEIQNVFENGTLNLKKSQTGSSLCQCSTTSIGRKKGNDGICISKSEKS